MPGLLYDELLPSRRDARLLRQLSRVHGAQAGAQAGAEAVSDSPVRMPGRRYGPRRVVPGKIAINGDVDQRRRQIHVYAYPEPNNAERERVVVRLSGPHDGLIDMAANDWCTLLDYMMEFLWGRDVEEAFDGSGSEEEPQAEGS